jgi:hypothetical protein
VIIELQTLMKKKHLTGKLHLFSDQGMEGGRLAIQDLNFIELVSPKHGLQNNREVLDKKSYTRTGITSNSEMLVNGTWTPLKDRIPSADLVRVTIKWNDGVVEKERISQTLFVEQWSYDGLHLLEEDDLLKVLEPKSGRVICEGQVNKIPLKISSSTLDGHFSQDTSNWKNYFTKKYTADVFKEIKTTTNKS